MAENENMERVRTVLVVDDDPEDLAFLSRAVGAQFPVLCATNGDDAVRLAQRTEPDVIILDVLMAGGMDGFTTFCELRKNPETAHIKVLMLTEVNKATKLQFSAAAMQTYLGEAPEAFLEKPIRPERLRQAVAMALGSAA